MMNLLDTTASRSARRDADRASAIADSPPLSRRRFLRQSGAAAAGVLGFPALLRSASPNSRLQVACVGAGGRGGIGMRSVATHPKVKIVALCDVDQRALSAAAKLFPDAARLSDWRELLSRHMGEFDAVTSGIADHMHAPVAMTALRAKKHVGLGTDGGIPGNKLDAAYAEFQRKFFEDRRKAGIAAPGEAPDIFNLVPEYNDPRRFKTLADDLASRG